MGIERLPSCCTLLTYLPLSWVNLAQKEEGVCRQAIDAENGKIDGVNGVDGASVQRWCSRYKTCDGACPNDLYLLRVVWINHMRAVFVQSCKYDFGP